MSETLARPTLSGDTRQCACGGWTRFVVCQYCGTTDPAVAAAGWVSSSPLTVPTAFDPVAVPPPAMHGQLPPPVPAPFVAQHDAPAMATATSAFADLHAVAPPSAPLAPVAPAPLYPQAPIDAIPPAPQALSAPPAAPAPAAPAAPTAFAPAGDPGAALVGAAAPGTYPAPLPVPPGATWSQGEAPSAPAPMPVAPESPPAEDPAPAAAPKDRTPRPRWVAPAAGVALVASAAAAYFVWFGGGSNTDSTVSVPPVHHTPQLTPALLTGTLPAGFTAAGAPASRKPSQISSDEAPGHPVAGATAAESLAAKNAKGSEISALALQFPTPAAASAWATTKAPQPKGQFVVYSTRGVFGFAVETNKPSDAAATAGVTAWAKSLGV